jgi:hypothetical protein
VSASWFLEFKQFGILPQMLVHQFYVELRRCFDFALSQIFGMYSVESAVLVIIGIGVNCVVILKRKLSSFCDPSWDVIDSWRIASVKD